MSEHTKGPWRTIGKGGTHDGGSTKQHPCFCGDILAKSGQGIVNFSSFIGVQGATPEEAEANARLIAAAPEYDAACKRFAAGWGHFCDRIDFANSALDAEAIRFMNEVPGEIAAAIAKAKPSKLAK